MTEPEIIFEVAVPVPVPDYLTAENDTHEEMIESINNYLSSLSEEKKLKIYNEYSDIMKYNKKRGYILYPTIDLEFNSYYYYDGCDCNINKLYQDLETDDKILLHLHSFCYDENKFFKKYDIEEIKEIIEFLYTNEKTKFNIIPKIMLIFAYTKSYSKGVDYFHDEILCPNDFDKYSKIELNLFSKVKNSLKANYESLESFYLYVCPFPESYFQEHKKYFREKIFPDLMAKVWHPSRMNMWIFEINEDE